MNKLATILLEDQQPSQPLPVIVDSRPVEFWRCPHCKEEIHEKHTFAKQIGESGEYRQFHRDCGGEIIFPKREIDPSTLTAMGRVILQGLEH